MMKRIVRGSILALSIVLIASACSKDDPNKAPDLNPNQTFTVTEDKVPGDNLGTVQVNDPDNDPLSFTITINDNNLFAIGESTGILTLANGQNLDFETATSHSVVVSVSDGKNTLDASVTINVENVIDHPLALELSSFITTWTTTEENEKIIIGTDEELTYSFTIDWGDGTIEEISASSFPSHEYATADTYTVAINGAFPRIKMFANVMNPPTAEKLTSIEQWGNQQWNSFNEAFRGCTNLTYNALDNPDLSNVTDLSYMFMETSAFDGDLNSWDVSTITKLKGTFHSSGFNGDLDNWDVRKVEDMSNMFIAATEFNGNISNWVTESVTDMQFMFTSATSFNQDLSNWNTANVTNMGGMFLGASVFNSDISNWNVELVEDMNRLFMGASAFDQDLGSWDIRGVTSMELMLSSSGLTFENYENVLIGWANQENVPSEITLGADGLKACSDEAQEAVDFLVNDKDWTIDDDGCNM